MKKILFIIILLAGVLMAVIPPLSFFPIFALSLSLFIIPGLLISLQLMQKKIYEPPLTIIVAFGISALLAYLVFWIYFTHYNSGRAATVIIMLGSLGILFHPEIRKDLLSHISKPDIMYPLLLMCAIGMMYTGHLYFFVPDEQHTAANHRFVWFAHDNLLPLHLANRFYHDVDPRPFYGAWLSSDRPPLQASVVLMQKPLELINGEVIHYQIIGTLCQCLWIPAIWALFRTARLSRFKIAMGFLILACTGFIMLNTVFVIPKMFAAGFVIGGFILLLGYRTVQTPYATQRVIIGAGLCGLGFLGHGGVIFCLVAMALVLLIPSRFLGVKHTALGALVFTVLFAPWAMYQTFFDPPGNRLFKWHIAGVVPPEDKRESMETLIAAYSELTIGEIVDIRVQNLETIIGNPLDAFDLDMQKIRDDESISLARALGILNVGWFVFLFGLIRRSSNKEEDDHDVSLIPSGFMIGILTTLVWLITMFMPPPDGTILKQSSTPGVLLLFAGLVYYILQLPRTLMYVVVAGHFIMFSTAWVFFKPARAVVDPFMSMLALFAFVGFLACLYNFAKPQDGRQDKPKSKTSGPQKKKTQKRK